MIVSNAIRKFATETLLSKKSVVYYAEQIKKNGMELFVVAKFY